MRVPILLMVLTVVTLLVGAFSARGQEGQAKTLTDVVFDGPEATFPDPEALTDREKTFIEEELKVTVDLDNLWQDDGEDTPLWVRFVRGILRSRQMEKVNGTKWVRWEACGERVPEEELYIRATTWAVSILASLDEVEKQTGIKINPWGAFATTANEGGFNECTLDFHSRKWAAENGVVDKFQLTYDKETVWEIINSKKWKRAKRKKADFGPYQMRFAVHRMTRDRFDDLLSVHPGVYLGVREMARRAKRYKHRHRLKEPHSRPWMMWPGYMVGPERKRQYDKKITSVARWLGARRGEI